MTIDAILRKAVKAAALPLGAPARRRVGDVVILLYHRVGVGGREIDVSVDALDRQLAFLREEDDVLSLDQVISNGARGGVVLTFDDGFSDFHEQVLPLLIRHRLPATLYLATGLVEEGPENGSAITWAQLREAVATGLVTVGSHTHGHVDLSGADEALAEEEMRRSKELIEDRLGLACRHFAYPWAVGSPAADRLSRRLFDSAALGAWQTNRAGRIDPHRLGRIPVLRSDGDLFFRAKVRGGLDAEGLAYRLLRRGPWRP
ncbi:MAG: polysaccharide deacetylase family protein [Actinomycetota bacterium]